MLDKRSINVIVELVEMADKDPVIRETVRQRYFARLERNSLVAEGVKEA